MLNVKNIKLNMTARTKEEVIEELTDLLIQDGAVTNKEEFIRDDWLQKNLVELVQKGVFREDLYYRLNVLTLNIPPLRDCPQDIMPLTELFVARFADEQGVPRPKLSADLGTVLTRYGWPGNIRQLKNAVYRALTQLEGYELRPQDILLPDYDAGTVSVGEEAMEGSLDDITSRFERSVLTQLYRSYPSTRKLAKRLGVSHTAIANKLREYGLNQKKGDE